MDLKGLSLGAPSSKGWPSAAPCGTWTVADDSIGARDHARCLDDALRDRVRPTNRRNADELHRQSESRDYGERLCSGANASLERGRHGHDARREHARRGRVHSLARHSPAREHGRSPGSQLPRHSPRRDLRVSLRRCGRPARTGTTVIRDFRNSAVCMVPSSSSRESRRPSSTTANTS